MNGPQPAPRAPEGAIAPTRRRVLQAAGITGVVAVAAACAPAVRATSSGGASTPASGPATPVPTASGSASVPLASGSASSAPSTGARLGPSSAVPVGGGTIYTARKVVVTQPVPGVFKGFSAVCPHLGCLVSTVTDERINCPCHGSQFSIFDGSRIAGPAPTGLSSADVTESGAELVLKT